MPPLRRGVRASDVRQDPGGSVATLPAPQGTSTKVSRRRYDPAWDDWNAPRRWPGILLSCVVVLGFLAIIIWHFGPSPAPAHHKNGLPPPSNLKGTFVIAGGTKDLAALFVGTKNRSNLQFASNGGLLVLHATCICAYNFDVTIDQGSFQPVDIPVSTVGNVNTALAVSLPKGDYEFQVIASGPWKLELIRPGTNLPPLFSSIMHPFKYFSSGDTVIGPFTPVDDHLALDFLSDGRNDVVTHILDLQGAQVASPFFGFSPYEHAITMRNLPDPYYLEISAVGFWNVEVRPASKG